MKTFLDFIDKKQKRIKLFEGFSQKSFDKVNNLILSILKKHTNEKIALIPNYFDTISNKMNMITSVYLIGGGQYTMHINWTTGNSSEVYSIDFFTGVDYLFNGRGNSILTILANGSSIVYFLPVIWTLINSGNYNISQEEAIKTGRQVFDKDNKEVKESKEYFVGALKYVIEKNNKIFKEDKAQTENIEQKYQQLEDDYKKLIDSINGAKSLDELKLSIQNNVPVSFKNDPETDKQEEELKNAHEDPEVVFKKMEHYIDMVINGVNPSLIICGAPGVGKTFRVTKKLKEAGYVEGENLCTIKGKCTGKMLYIQLYKFKEKGQIVIIDDADSLIGKGAEENSINILKGALDSTSDPEGKLITWQVATKISDDEGNEIPKKFYYNGSVIIITNWNAGNLDTALKGRSFVQDIHFTVEDALKIIKSIMPNIEKGKLSPQAKILAYQYLQELSKNNVENMEISIRTYGICAKIFETALTEGDDFGEEEAKAMIYEQMKLQAERRGNKY